jgi:uncharacterized membrane protein
MSIFEMEILFTAFLCSLVSGFLFAFAIVIMPGIKNLDDKQFIKTFQTIDRIIQDNQPLFLMVWVGSIVSLILCAITGFAKLQGVDLGYLLLATLAYLGGVQALTIFIHLPLNNKLQKYDVEAMNEVELHAARQAFEPRWNRSNVTRTVIASCVSLLLIMLALRY